MNALRLHGGGETSSRISVKVGGRVAAMVDRGDGEGEMKTPLTGRDDDRLKEQQSSNADKGRGLWSRSLGMVR